MVVGGRELIDTLWNVNFSRRLAPALIHQELIDTLWNVNLAMKSLCWATDFRINRYIMECKCYLAGFALPASGN